MPARDPEAPAEAPERAENHFVAAFDRLHQSAVRETGLADFGDPAYEASLRFLLECYDREAQFGTQGRERTERMLVDSLRSRLFATAGIGRNPGCLDTALDAPVVIAGLPRTGSTALHKLLAADVHTQALEYWLGCAPDVRPPRAQWPEHPGYRAAERALQRIYERSPDLKAAHSMRPDEADECRLLFMQDFLNQTFCMNATIPSYEAWLLDQDMGPAYRRYRDNLKLIGARDTDKRWILKNSSHLWALPTLDASLPGCCIIETHRSPMRWISSVSSLVYKSRTIYEPEVLPREVGAQQLRQWGRIVERSRRDRARHPELAERILDVHYDHFTRDPLATLRRIYEHFDLRWTAAGERRIREWAEQNPPERHGVHHYSAEEYGLSEQSIADAFGDYLAWEERLASEL